LAVWHILGQIPVEISGKKL